MHVFRKIWNLDLKADEEVHTVYAFEFEPVEIPSLGKELDDVIVDLQVPLQNFADAEFENVLRSGKEACPEFDDSPGETTSVVENYSNDLKY